jgi:phosphoenolpyruvate carboxykinase (ATP)
MILIGGTGYTGEIKKGIFSVLNYILPQEKKYTFNALFS